jgi:hypothetical protein
VAALALLGASGLTYGVLMAHGRFFVPDPLLGRGLTLMNILFIGGAGIVQPISGALMSAMKDRLPSESYAMLHVGFGIALIATLVIYLFAKDVVRKAP